MTRVADTARNTHSGDTRGRVGPVGAMTTGPARPLSNHSSHRPGPTPSVSQGRPAGRKITWFKPWAPGPMCVLLITVAVSLDSLERFHESIQPGDFRRGPWQHSESAACGTWSLPRHESTTDRTQVMLFDGGGLYTAEMCQQSEGRCPTQAPLHCAPGRWHRIIIGRPWNAFWPIFPGHCR